MYLFRRVLFFRGTYKNGIILTFLVGIWYRINRITYYLGPIIPFQTDIGRYFSRSRYSDISKFFFGAFQKLRWRFFAKPIRYNGLLHSTSMDWTLYGWSYQIGINWPKLSYHGECIASAKAEDLSLHTLIYLSFSVNTWLIVAVLEWLSKEYLSVILLEPVIQSKE